MKEAVFQRKDKTLVPFSEEDLEAIKAFPEHQFLKVKITGSKRPRSLQQNKWVHAMFRLVAANTDDPKWDTDVKVKRNVKMAMKFFKDEVIVHRDKVWFELRSFAFDEMEQAEADIKYNEAKLVCAKFLDVPPEELEARVKEEG